MQRFDLYLTDELLAAVDHAKGLAARNRYLEELLWQAPEIKKAARKLKLKRKRRPRQGERAK